MATSGRSSRHPARKPDAPVLRLRVGFVLIMMVLSFFGAKLVQLQGLDPKSYARMAAAEGAVSVVLPATRGDILDRNGEPFADSVNGEMVVADPSMTRPRAREIARFLSQELQVDYFKTLTRLTAANSRFQYIARRVPSAQAEAVLQKATDLGFEGLATRLDPVRVYPAKDVAANLVGYLGTPSSTGAAQPLAGLEQTFNAWLSGHNGEAKYTVGGGNIIPLADQTVVAPVSGQNLDLTLDLDLQWYTQRVLRQAVLGAKADSGSAVVIDTRTGAVLSLADFPTYDASNPPQVKNSPLLAPRSLTDAYEPGSVEKILTASSLIDAGKVTDRTKINVPPVLMRQDRPIHDWFPHGRLHLTMAGVIAKSSNIGTVKAADSFTPQQLRAYLTKFGLGARTDVGVAGETRGILPDGAALTSQVKDRMAFGQSLSVNALQMAAAVNTVANGGVYVSPSLIEGAARMDDGTVVGTDKAITRRVVRPLAANEMMKMMERVVDPATGTAPLAQVPGYRVAGKTGTAQRVNPNTGLYDGSKVVSFAGFAPADQPRFTVYVVINNPKIATVGGGMTAGPVFSKIMGYALRRYAVPPTGTPPSHLPITW